MNKAYFSAALALLFVSTDALAGANSRYSHCYKIKDSQEAASYTVDLQPTDFRFPDSDGCTIKTPAKMICIDAIDSNLTPPGPGILGGYSGQKYLCYKAKCPNDPGAPEIAGVGDALGVRDVTFQKTKQVCVPIIQDSCVSGSDCRPRNNVTGAGCDTNGFCTVESCNSNSDDCNNYYADGCETSLLFDSSHCGACGNECLLSNADSFCSSGSCAISSCNTNFSDCDMTASTGCETDVSSDPSNCGGCNNVCSTVNAIEGCVSGNCVIESCDPGYADCDASALNGCETNISIDTNNCGTCGNFCSGTCTGGICTP